MNLKFLFTMIISLNVFNSAFAEYDYHYTDIYHPMFNFILLFGLIGWKLKGTISDAFTKRAEDVETHYIMAEEKDKEAQIKLDMFTDKIANLEQARAKILKNAQNDVKNFEKEFKKEIDESIERAQKESLSRLSSEKNEMLRDLSQQLLENVISKTKSSIVEGDGYRQKATEKLLNQVK